MGTLFRYVADEALRPVEAGAACQTCGETGVPVYPYSGIWVRPDGGSKEVDELCRSCILGKDVRLNAEDLYADVFGAPQEREETGRTDIVFPDGEDFVQRGGYRILKYRLVPRWEGPSAELLGKLRRTPESPLMLQRPDWVVCCGDLAEFIGSPDTFDELLDLADRAIYWERGVGGEPRDFAATGLPEDFEEISIFRCLWCEKLYWIDQFT